jgi:LemA protein
MGWVILAIAIGLVLIGVNYWNRIQILDNRVKNSWAQIDVQLKRRNDLVPNLVETVKGYAAHEKAAIEAVTTSRERMMQAGARGDIDGQAEAANMMAGALKTIFAIAENYPDLKANQNFLVLQEELAGIENKIAYARQFYNDSVLSFNNLIQTFPGLLFKGSRKPHVYLEVPEAEKAVPAVSFSAGA